MFMYWKLLSALFQAAVSSSELIPEKSVWALDDQMWTSGNVKSGEAFAASF